MKRSDILQTAEKCVCGQRQQDYGTPENNFQAIADLWNAYFKNTKAKPITDIDNGRFFSAFDVAMLMALLKVGRIATGTATEDSFVDACGYLACGGEIKANQSKVDKESVMRAPENTKITTEAAFAGASE